MTHNERRPLILKRLEYNGNQLAAIPAVSVEYKDQRRDLRDIIATYEHRLNCPQGHSIKASRLRGYQAGIECKWGGGTTCSECGSLKTST